MRSTIAAAAVLTGVASALPVSGTPGPATSEPVEAVGWSHPSARRAARGEPTVTVRGDDHAFAQLERAEMQGALAARSAAPGSVIALPTPAGGYARFTVAPSGVLAPALAARFPSIRTYSGTGLDDPAATVVIDVSPGGLHAQVLTPSGAWYVDPVVIGDDSVHIAYRGDDVVSTGAIPEVGVLGRDEEITAVEPSDRRGSAARPAVTMRRYRLAVSTTQQYSNFFITDPEVDDDVEVLAAVTTAVNRVTGIYETELGVTLELVADNDRLFTYSEPDGFTNDNATALLAENQEAIDDIIGSPNYDVGHIFSTGGGGLAGLGVIGIARQKARGVTGNSSPTSDTFWVDYVAHELGHQFGADHTFNGRGGNCETNVGDATAVEPGSGSTIMSYAGICDADDLQDHSDPFFHTVSWSEIQDTMASPGQGGSTVTTANHEPAVRVVGGRRCGSAADGTPRRCFVIPPRTPFRLTAAATDEDGDSVTYSWEQIDGFTQRSLRSAQRATGALFRVFTPSTSGVRWFPALDTVRTNRTTAEGRCRRLACWVEFLPTVERRINFRVSARDNNPVGGGVAVADARVSVRGTTPFLVTSPDTAVRWVPGSSHSIRWNVARTRLAPVSTPTVDILLSTDGGRTFSTVLVSDVPNDGAQRITLPDVSTTKGRIMVRAHGNIFYDMSDADIVIA